MYNRKCKANRTRNEVMDSMQNNLKYIRKQKKLTQEQLAQLIGISRPYLSEIERGRTNPSVKITLKIANVLNVPVETIFYDNTVMHAEHTTPPHEGREAG